MGELLWLVLVVVVVLVGAWVLLRVANLLEAPLGWLLTHVAAAGYRLGQRWHQWRRR
jgi:hypothetical protein